MVDQRRLAGQTRANMEARARIMKALAHPSRLFIVDELSRGERCVCELTEMIGADVSTVSKHLALLKNAGIVLDVPYRTCGDTLSSSFFTQYLAFSPSSRTNHD
jgi:DNA-binding transcriptional ArsR family regulator